LPSERPKDFENDAVPELIVIALFVKEHSPAILTLSLSSGGEIRTCASHTWMLPEKAKEYSLTDDGKNEFPKSRKPPGVIGFVLE
jgi:hypothetical protein